MFFSTFEKINQIQKYTETKYQINERQIRVGLVNHHQIHIDKHGHAYKSKKQRQAKLKPFEY